MSYLSDNAYMAIKPETTAGTAVTPTVFVPLVSESMKTVVNHEADKRMKGLNWGAENILRGNRSHEGEITILADADNAGHMLNMLMAKGSTTGNGTDGYTHPFTVSTPKTYTIDIKKGAYVQRYFGCMIDEAKFSFEDQKLTITASIKAQGQVSIMSVGVALSGAVTSLVLDDEYDIAPNRGLVVGDVLTVGGVDVTLTSVNANGTTVGFSSTSITASIGAVVVLKPQTVTLPTVYEPLLMGNALVGFGADASSATTASASRSTATPVYGLEVTVKNNLFAQNGTNRLDPSQLIPQTREATVTVKQLFENASQRQAFLARTKQAIVVNILGKFIKSDFTTQEKLVFTFNNVRLLSNDNTLNVGEIIADEQEFAVTYDGSDAQAMAVSLINRTAGTSY